MAETYEQILDRALDRIPNTYDKREGSVIFDAIAPMAYELSIFYQLYETLLNNTFAGTANREWLIKRCSEIGIAPFEATYAERKGIFTPTDLEIAIGERFNYEQVNFIVTEKLDDGVYALRCETAGEVGNLGEGRLIPINYINGLETAYLSGEVLVYGEEDEDTEVLRQRYFDTLPTMTLDGNIAQYRKWCREYAGIGNHKIFPLWNGLNTVKVSILSSENTKASDELIEDFQNYLDPESKGLGMGKAPIGAVVTVATATEKPINIDAVVIYRQGYSYPIGLEESINDYLLSLNYSRTTVSYTAIAALLQNNESIDLVMDITINGAKANIELGEEEIASLGTLNVTEG